MNSLSEGRGKAYCILTGTLSTESRQMRDNGGISDPTPFPLLQAVSLLSWYLLLEETEQLRLRKAVPLPPLTCQLSRSGCLITQQLIWETSIINLPAVASFSHIASHHDPLPIPSSLPG